MKARTQGRSTGQHLPEAENERLRGDLERLRAKMSAEAGGTKISDTALARKIGVSQAAIAKYRGGGGFSLQASEGLARALGETTLTSIQQADAMDYTRSPCKELRAVLEYWTQGDLDHGWSKAAIFAAIGKSIDGERHSRGEWEQILTRLTEMLKK